MKDFYGNPLNIGDRVAFIERYYRNFRVGVITKCGKAKVTISLTSRNGNDDVVYRFPQDVIKEHKSCE